MRIGSLVSAATEIAFALGLGPHVVGVSHECDFPPEIAGLPRLTRTLIDASRPSREIDVAVRRAVASGGGNADLYHVDAEAIAKAGCDVLLAQRLCEVCAVSVGAVERELVGRGGIRVVTLTGGDLAGVWDDIRRVADACGVREAGERLVRSLDERRVRVRERVAGKPRPRVVCLEWLDPPFDAGHWVPEQIADAGGEEALARRGLPSRDRPWSDIADADPDVVLLMPCGFGVERACAEARALWSVPAFAQLRAVRSKHAFVVDGNALFSRPGPRLVDGIELAADLFHSPERALATSAARVVPGP